MAKAKPIPRTKSGLISGARIRFGDRRFFNKANDHNPVVGEPCDLCRGEGRFGASLIRCSKCEGVGAFDRPVHFFSNSNPPAEARARPDGWVTCPGCKYTFSLELGDWTGWRHGCGQRITVLPPASSNPLAGLVNKLRWSFAIEKKHALALLTERGYLLGYLWAGAVLCLFLIYTIWYSSLISVDPANSSLISFDPALKQTELHRWYVERRHALRASDPLFAVLGYISAVGIAWLGTCLAFRHAYGSKMNPARDGLYGCLSFTLGAIYLFLPPLLAIHFVFPVVALHGVSVSPSPSPWQGFAGHLMFNVWMFVGWTATLLGLVASVITIYETWRKNSAGGGNSNRER